MNLFICVFFLFLMGTEILAKDEDQSAGSVILQLNSILSKMVTSDDLATYRNLSTEALKITQGYFKNEKATAVPNDEELSIKTEDFDRPAGNNTDEKADDNDGTRRQTYDEKDAKFCDTLFNNVDVALRLVELNLIELKAHPSCVHGKSIRGQHNEMEIIKIALDKWSKQQLGRYWPLVGDNIDSGITKRYPELKSDFIILASVLAPGFTPTPPQIQRLETILKRPVFVNILHSNPYLCDGYELRPQVNPVGIPSAEKIPRPFPGKLQSGINNQYYISPHRPFENSYNYIPSSLDSANTYSKYEKIVQKPDSLNVLQKPKEPLWPLLLNTKDIPSSELHKMLQVTSKGDLTSKNLNLAPLIKSTPISEKLWKLLNKVLNSPSYVNSGLSRPSILYPKGIKTPYEREKLKRLLTGLGQTPVNLPLKLDSLPYKDNIVYPIAKKQIQLPPPFFMNAKPISSNEISRLLDIPEKHLPTKIRGIPPVNKVYSSPINKPLAIPIDVLPMRPKKPMDILQYPYQQKPQLDKYSIHLDGPQATDYLGNPMKKNMKYPHSLFTNAPYKSQKYNLYDDLPKPNLMDKMLHNVPTPEFLHGGNDGNRGDTIYPDYEGHNFGSPIYKKPVKSKYQRPLHPLMFQKGVMNYYDEVNHNDPKIPFLINEFKNKGKGPIKNNIPLIPNDILYANNIKPYNIQRPSKYIKKQNSEENISPVYQDDRIINPLYKNKDDNTKHLPLNLLSQDLYHTSPKKTYFGDKFSQINPKLPLDLTLGNLEQKNPKWLQIPSSFDSDGIGLGLNENFEQNSQYNQNPFKNSYQIDDLLNKTPHELLQSGGGTNWIKLATSRPSQTEVELIFLMKAQEPIIYWPVYYLSYRIPTATLINKFKTTPVNKPILTSTDHILYELVNSEPYSAISPELKKLHTQELYRLLVKNGLIVAANIYKNNHKINNEDYLITMDKIINNPNNYAQINSNYFRSGPIRSEDISEIFLFDQNVSHASINDKDDRGRRLLARYYYRPRTTYHKIKPAIISPLAYKLQALKKLRAIQALKQLQRQQDFRFNVLKSRKNVQIPFNNASSESLEIKSNSPLTIVPHNKNAKSDTQTIDIHLASSMKGEEKVASPEETDDDQIETTTVPETENIEDLSVRGLKIIEENSKDRFHPNIIDAKNNTARSDTYGTGSTNESYTTIKLNVTEETVTKPLDDFLIY